MNVTLWAHRAIRIGFYLLFALVPLLLTPWNYELFEYNKMMAVYAITVVIGVSWIIKMIHEKEIRIARTPLDIPIALFFLSQLVSTIFSMDPHVSWFGYYSRFNGGMLSIISYIVLYYAFVTNRDVWPASKQKNTSALATLLKLALATGAVIAFYGVLERMGIDKNLWVQDVQNRVFSTLGQPNWLAAYLVGLFPLTLAFILPKARLTWRFVAALCLPTLFFITLLFTRSRSGLLGFVAADAVFWGILFFKTKGQKVYTQAALVFHALIFLLLFFIGTSVPSLDRFTSFQGVKDQLLRTAPPQEATAAASAPGPLLETGGTESGVIRKYVWEGAFNAWKSSPKTIAIGTGVETFAFAFYRFRPQGHNLTSEWDFLYNKAHNEYLNYLATTGLFGLGSYAAVIAVFAICFVRKQKRQELSTLSVALFAGWVSILVTNFFGFSVVATQLMFFLFPAFILLFTNEKQDSRSWPMTLPSKSMLVVAFVGVYPLFVLVRFWQADAAFAQGYRMARAGNAGGALPLLVRATAYNRGEPLYHDELGALYASIAASAYESKDATTAAQFLAQSTREHDRALVTSPQNVNFLKTRTKIYVTLSTIDPAYTTDAIATLERSLTLSPNDPKIYYNLAVLEGRLSESDKAIDYLKSAIAMKPNYRDAYFALWVFYTEAGKHTDAQQVLRDYLTTVDPNDKDFQSRLPAQGL